MLAGRNPAKLETAKAELDELGVESDLYKTDIADRAQVQALADYAASLGSVKQIIHTSGVSPSDTGTEKDVYKRQVQRRHSPARMAGLSYRIGALRALELHAEPALYVPLRRKRAARHGACRAVLPRLYALHHLAGRCV